MSSVHLLVIGLLSVAAFAIRVTGLIAGARLRTSRHAWILDDLPGLIVVSLVTSSLVAQPLATWIAAMVALSIAVVTNHVITTMVLSVAAFTGMAWLGLR